MSEPSPATRGTLWVIVASATLTVMAGAIIAPVVPQIQAGLNVSGSLAGLVITTHGAFIVLTSPVAGAVIDRIGPRRPYIGGLALYAIAGVAGGFTDSIGPMLVTRAFVGVGVGFAYTGVTVLIYDLNEGRRMERALGLRSSANSLGAAMWPLVGGALGTVAWQFPFGVYLIALLLGLIAIATVPGTGRGSGATDEVPRPGGMAPIVDSFRRSPALVLVYLLYFVANLLLFAIVVYYPQLLVGIGVTSSLTISLYLGGNGAAGGVSAALYDRLARLVGNRTLVGAAFGLWTVAFWSASSAESALAAAPAVILFGLGVGLVFPTVFVWVEAMAPKDRQGQFGSYVASFGYIGQFLSPVLFGPLVPLYGIRGVFTAAAGTAVVGLLGIVLAGLFRD